MKCPQGHTFEFSSSGRHNTAGCFVVFSLEDLFPNIQRKQPKVSLLLGLLWITVSVIKKPIRSDGSI